MLSRSFTLLYLFGLALVTSQRLAGDWLDPSSDYRPKFIYWFPDASVSIDSLKADLRGVASAGGGGITFSPHYFFGFPLGDMGIEPPTDWTQYGFASEAYMEIFQALLETAVDEDVKMNFMLGGSQGQGVPAPPMSRGLAMHLLAGNATVSGGETYDDEVPPPSPLSDQLRHGHFYQFSMEEFGQPNLTAVLALEIVDFTTINGMPTWRIEEHSIVDLTDQVREGRIRWTAPDGDSDWRIMTFWEHFTNQRSVVGGVNATDFIGNGSWVVDHFSRDGAQLLTNFLDEHILSHDKVGDLVRELGSLGFEDSLEISAALWWSRNFLTTFEESKGYSLVKYLPLLFTQFNQFRKEFASYGEEYVYGPYNDRNVSLHNLDYLSVLTHGYGEFLSGLTQWSHGVGMKYSSQPGYNLPLDMSASIPHVDIPETESLAFLDEIDKYKRFTGPAHIAGKDVISSELGAILLAYTQTLSNIVWQMKRSWAAGVNEFVLHGLQYTGEYPATTWPGVQSLFYVATEAWGPLQPGWQHVKDVFDFAARTNVVLRQGQAKVDLAFYAHEPVFEQGVVNDQTPITDQGYTYEYLGPSNFELPSAEVRQQALATDGPAYRALVFVNQTGISSSAAEKILSYAQGGLPIFVVGTPPQSAISAVENEQDKVTRAIEQLMRENSVVSVRDQEELVKELERADVLPRAMLRCTNGPVYTNWRTTGDLGDDFVYIYNDHDAETICDFTFTTTSPETTPYKLDAWTGNVSFLTDFSRPGPHQITKRFSLVATETVLLQFSTSSDSTAIINTNSDALYTIANPDTNTLLSATPLGSPTNLSRWNITVESWHGPLESPPPFSVLAVRSNYTFDSSALDRWGTLDDSLAGVSGVGIYTTRFACPAEARDVENPGAILSLPPIEHTLRGSLNGVSLPPFDHAKPQADLTPYLRCGQGEDGENVLEIVITTNLFNAVKAYADTALSMGLTVEDMGADYESEEFVEVGLVGPVSLTWVQWNQDDIDSMTNGVPGMAGVEGLMWPIVVGVGLLVGAMY